MRRGVTIWIKGALITAVAAPLLLADEVAAQEFKIPPSVSHFVYRPGEDLAQLVQVQGWTFGLGLTIGAREPYTDRQRGIYGFVAQATYGGPYWYWSAGAGMWNGGTPEHDNFGFGVNVHYNVFQSRDHRTRLGPQFGWSTGSTGDARTHVFNYRAVVSHTLSPSWSLYGGLGAESSRFSTGGEKTRRVTNPSVLGGVYTRLNERWGFSTGVETVFTDPVTFTFAGSVQFEPHHEPEALPLQSLAGQPGLRPRLPR